jgi:hypothetical protein
VQNGSGNFLAASSLSRKRQRVGGRDTEHLHQSITRNMFMAARCFPMAYGSATGKENSTRCIIEPESVRSDQQFTSGNLGTHESANFYIIGVRA